jgi:predicted O-methyltransferase YrrM
LKSNWQIIDRADREALPMALKKLPSIDMCHYDSDKSYDGRIWAYPSLWKALRPDGVFISDDIGDNLAFHDFCNQVNQVPVIVGSTSEVETKYVGVLVKTAD